MDSWTEQTSSSPDLKFEASPAESFLSTPDEMYPSLFAAAATPAQPATMNPSDIMTPKSLHSDDQTDVIASMAAGIPASAATDDSQTSDKKPTKKRKSWGQVLPEPKTNLPPRKRAKTDDEKEQRRVERVLRNRRAAQSSRERKRLEVEALEKRNKELENMVLHLVDELNKARQGGSSASSAASLVGLRPNPLTFSQELFSSQDSDSKSSPLDLLMSGSSDNTVNPASLSPALSPIADEEEPEDEEEEDADDAHPVSPSPAAPKASAPAATVADASADLTQHPAEMLCEDLQCQSAEESPRSAPAWLPSAAAAMAFQQQLSLLLLASTSAILSVCRRPLTQIAMSLKAGFSLPQEDLSILNTIIWLVTMSRRAQQSRPRSSTPSPAATASTSLTSTSSSMTPSSPPSQQQRTPQPSLTASPTPLLPLPAATRATAPPAPALSSSSLPTRPTSSSLRTSLRLRTLRKILTCSPTLARPLTDATMAVLRLVSSDGHAPRVDQVEVPSGVEADGRRRQAVATALTGEESTAARASVVSGGINGEERQAAVLDRAARQYWEGQELPSREVLLTLLWALRVEQLRKDGWEQQSGRAGMNVASVTTTKVAMTPTKAAAVKKRAAVVVGGSTEKSVRRRLA